MNEDRRPLRILVDLGDRLLNWIALFLILLLFLYSAYSIWHTRSLTEGTFLAEEMVALKPTAAKPTLEELSALNDDTCAWLTIDDTHIDYPVVQGENDFYYLNRSIQGEFSLAGAIFLSTANRRDFTDPYNVIYGHHVVGGAMFSDVLEFRDRDFFDAHTTGTLWIPEGVYHIDVFAYMDVDAMDDVIYRPADMITWEVFPEVMDYIREKAMYFRTPPAGAERPIVVLSTCESAESFGRCVLFGQLTPMTEAEVAAMTPAEEPPVEEEPQVIVEPIEKGRLQAILETITSVPPRCGIFWAVVIALAVILLSKVLQHFTN